MLCAYYSKGYDSNDLFKNFKIASAPSFKEHLNNYHTIFLNITTEFNDAKKNISAMIANITVNIVYELKRLDASIAYRDESLLH